MEDQRRRRLDEGGDEVGGEGGGGADGRVRSHPGFGARVAQPQELAPGLRHLGQPHGTCTVACPAQLGPQELAPGVECVLLLKDRRRGAVIAVGAPMGVSLGFGNRFR